MPKREDTPRQGYEPIPKACPHGHWIGIRCEQCENEKQKCEDIFTNVIWNNPQPIKNFYGITLGYFEHKNIHTNEMLILEAIVDLTHRRFIFTPYIGNGAHVMKTQIDQALTAPSASSFAILWTWVKHNQWFRKNLLYNMPPFPKGIPFGNNTLSFYVSELWQLCLQYNEIYKDKPFPQLPNQLKSKIKWLEKECKLAIKER